MDLPVEDSLEALGLAVGAYLVLVGLATLVWMPWTLKSGGVAVTVANVGGAVAAVAVGAGLAWLVRR